MYRKLLGPLGTAPSFCGECLFVDPVSDLAILGRPSGQDFGEKVVAAWDDFIEDIDPLELDTDQPTRGWLLSLERQWMPCTIQITGEGGLMVKNAIGCIVGEMSGSPILSDNGRVVGVVSITSNCSQAHLPSALPQWLGQNLLRRGNEIVHSLDGSEERRAALQYRPISIHANCIGVPFCRISTRSGWRPGTTAT